MFFATVVLFFSIAIATPIERATSCSPNFQGVPMSVVSGNGREWRPEEPVGPGSVVRAPSADRYFPDFRIEQTGGPNQPPEYIFKTIKDPSNSLVASTAARTSGVVFLEPFSQGKAQQHWKILCDVCGTDPWNIEGLYSYGCKIQHVPTGGCAEVGPGSSSPVYLAACNGSAEQTFEFWTEYQS